MLWTKLKNFFFYLVGWPEEIYFPAKCRFIEKNEKTLIGRSYYFQKLQNRQITSPLTGTIKRIYPNHTLQVIGQGGVQILLAIEFAEKGLISSNKIFHCQVKKGQKVTFRTVLFVVFQPEKIKRVTIHLPWQPTLLETISTNFQLQAKPFLKIYYRNPLTKLIWKQHGEY